MRPPVTQGDPEALRVPDGDVGAEFTRRNQECQAQQIGGDRNQGSRLVRAFDEIAVIVDRSVRRGILHQGAKDGDVELERLVISQEDPNAQRTRPGPDHLNRLRVAGQGHKERARIPLVERLTHVHGFRRRSPLVQQRGIGDFQTGQISNHRLKIQQRFQTPLRDLRLIRRVLRVPARVLENIALNYRRRNAVVIPHAQEGTADLILGGDLFQSREYGALVIALWKPKGALQPDGPRYGLVDQGIQGCKFQKVQHLPAFFLGWPDVSAGKGIRVCEDIHGGRLRAGTLIWRRFHRHKRT